MGYIRYKFPPRFFQLLLFSDILEYRNRSDDAKFPPMNRCKGDSDNKRITLFDLILQKRRMHRALLKNVLFLRCQMKQLRDIHIAYLILTHLEHFTGAAIHQNDRACPIRRNYTVAHIRQNRSQLLFLFLVLCQCIAKPASHIVKCFAKLSDLVISPHRHLLMEFSLCHGCCPSG
ncbi:hypothetical protein D3C78_1071130 [compost metagenome]